jgi:hypothetical protein
MSYASASPSIKKGRLAGKRDTVGRELALRAVTAQRLPLSQAVVPIAGRPSQPYQSYATLAHEPLPLDAAPFGT